MFETVRGVNYPLDGRGSRIRRSFRESLCAARGGDIETTRSGAVEIVEDWLTSTEIAARFGITTQAVRMAIRRGRIAETDCRKRGRDWEVRGPVAGVLWRKQES